MKTYNYPVFTATINVNPEKTPGQYMCQSSYFEQIPNGFISGSSNSTVWNTNKATGLGTNITVWAILAMATALFVCK